jgi:hypothetical protein
MNAPLEIREYLHGDFILRGFFRDFWIKWTQRQGEYVPKHKTKLVSTAFLPSASYFHSLVSSNSV